MPFALALVQAGSDTSQDQTLFIILGVITLATLVALGLRFLVNMRDVLIAPTASLGHLGQTDNFFFSLFVVFLGGLIGLFGIIPRKAELISAFNEYAAAVTNDIALGNSNSIYRDSAQTWGQEVLMNNFQLFGIENAIFFPILMVVLWIFVGTICFGAAKIMGTGTSYGDFLGGLAYSSFFANIGFGCVFLFGIQTVAGTASKSPATPGIWGIVGIVLLVYALILFLMGISQAGDLTTGQVIGVLIVLLIVVAGASYGIYAMMQEPWDAFEGAIRSFDPSRGSV